MNIQNDMKTSPFIGAKIGDYEVISEVAPGEGSVGSVFLLERKGEFPDIRAIKFVLKSNLRLGWQNEITKVSKLKTTEGVVKYLAHDFKNVGGEEYLWIEWEYIEGDSLKKCIKEKRVTVPILIDVVRRVLSVLHACKQVGVQHADLHPGNVLVEKENPLNIDSECRRIWITDFGYCTASMGKEALDDICGLHRIIQDTIAALDWHVLDGQDKALLRVLKNEFSRDLQETNATEGEWVRNPQKLLRRLESHLESTNNPAPHLTRHLGDYLAAELIGDREDEWKVLFVPDFIGRSTLLERNICVLTGLRGCGKTMVFRRLTALFDCRLGPSKVEGAEQFVGFYVNARSIAEAFPWLPDEKEHEARAQIINYFHLCWCQEIFEWLREETRKKPFALGWLIAFFKKIYGDRLLLTAGEDTELIHLIAFMTGEVERCRLKSQYHSENWELTDLSFLEKLTALISQNVISVGNRPFFFFLDDYSTPLVTIPIQRILNAIVFRRSANVVFKVATESTESFEPIGLNSKPLEENDDYVLIDSSSQVMGRSDSANRDLLSAILKPRIGREARFNERNLTLSNILGPTPYSYIELANQLKAKEKQTEVVYYGERVFSAIYSSNVREMISLFAEMVTAEDSGNLNKEPSKDKGLIRPHIQNKSLRDAGGKFLSLLAAATNPSEKLYEARLGDQSFGDHLTQIADAFQVISNHELKTKEIKNQGAYNPKQARRIELTNFDEDLPDDVREYYRGMIRYGLFIRDYKGKSVRGKAVPRLVLRGLLIPYYTLTFSKHDSITMTFDRFCDFLRQPKEFAQHWTSNTDKGTENLL